MKEENPHVFRALSVTRKDPIAQSKTTLSSFINITFPQPKIRIKLPKLLAKTLRRRNPKKCNDTRNANDSKKNNNNRSIKTGNIFSKKVGSIVSNVFGNKKPATKSSGRKDVIGNEETGDTEEAKTEAKAPLHLPENFDERNGKQVSSSNLIRVPNRKIRRGRSVRKKEITDRAKGNENEGKKEEEEERGEEEEEELCKKRILMGQKCRPLHQSGLLHYDENGVLLPEVDYLCQEL
ncbi:uncharacterized protein LOC131326948 [Rhododendron vialii]|uniref:uncharacterized protein LOC131326948 n=1 Tax=Rhododendron vialii TaxID=182163 RepID=UPI00265FB68A|nr:uncharacterized protein LOC131326948 [Rhododendron vialii]